MLMVMPNQLVFFWFFWCVSTQYLLYWYICPSSHSSALLSYLLISLLMFCSIWTFVRMFWIQQKGCCRSALLLLSWCSAPSWIAWLQLLAVCLTLGLIASYGSTTQHNSRLCTQIPLCHQIYKMLKMYLYFWCYMSVSVKNIYSYCQ